MTSSQPAPRCCASTDAGGGGDDVDVADSVQLAVGSFTQPAHYDELVLGTQVPCTPGASQVGHMTVM